MSQTYPLPRSTRDSGDLTATASQTDFGPFDFILFDDGDVEVLVTVAGETPAVLDQADYTVVPSTTLPGLFSVTLDTGLAAGTIVRVRGKRTHERETNVTQGGTVRSVPLETELDRQTVTLQELRRDIDGLEAEIDSALEAAVAEATGAAGDAQEAAEAAADDAEADANATAADRVQTGLDRTAAAASAAAAAAAAASADDAEATVASVAPAATRTALAALTPSAGDTRYLAEEGREGHFGFDDGDLSTEVTADTEQGLYVPPSSDTTGASGAWVRVYAGAINVRWFGAKGDDSTDDTTAIQAALDSGAKRLQAAQGKTYLVSGVTIPAGVTFDLAGATLKLADSSDAAVVSLSGARAELIGGKVDGNKANQASGNGVEIAADDCRVEGVLVQDAKGYGIYAADGNRPRIKNNHVVDSGSIGIFVESTDTDISDPVISGNIVDRASLGTSLSLGGIMVHSVVGGTQVARARIEGNAVLMPSGSADDATICIEAWGPKAAVVGNTTSGGYMGISVAGWEGGSVAGNTVYDPKTYGIELGGTNGADYTSVSGNTIDCNSVAGHGVVVNVNTSFASITGNVIKNSTAAAIEVLGDNNMIVGNMIDIAAGRAIMLSGVEGAVVSANFATGNGTATKGITIDESSTVAITGNSCINFSQDSILFFGDAAVTLNEIVVVGNHLEQQISSLLTGGAALGSSVKVLGNTGANQGSEVFDWLNDVELSRGNNTPEASVTSNIGSLRLRSNGGVASTLYVKEAGSGNTGWAPVLTNKNSTRGDADVSLSFGATGATQVFKTELTADRTVSLSTGGNAANGSRFRIVRTAAATGAFNLNVGTGPLIALAAGEWCEVEYDGSAWFLSAAGSL